MKLSDALSKILGNTIYLQIILMYYEERNMVTNITGIAKALGKSQATVRKAIKDMIDVGILEEALVGRSIVVRLKMDGHYTKIIIDFVERMDSIIKERYFELESPRRL